MKISWWRVSAELLSALGTVILAISVVLSMAACSPDWSNPSTETTLDQYVEVSEFWVCPSNDGPVERGDAPCVVTGLDQTRYYSDTQSCPELRDADHQIAPLCVIFSEWSNQT